MSNPHSVPEDIGLDEVDFEASIQVDGSNVKVNISDNEKPKPRRSRTVQDVETNFATNRNVAEGMMDLALLTANANQLRFVITYNSKSPMFFVSMGLIITSLVLQVAVGVGLIFKRKSGKKSSLALTNRLVIVGIFLITFVNILIAALTSTDSEKP